MKNKKILLLAATLYTIRVSVGIQVQKFRDARSNFRDGVEDTALRSLLAYTLNRHHHQLTNEYESGST